MNLPIKKSRIFSTKYSDERMITSEELVRSIDCGEYSGFENVVFVPPSLGERGYGLFKVKEKIGHYKTTLDCDE